MQEEQQDDGTEQGTAGTSRRWKIIVAVIVLLPAFAYAGMKVVETPKHRLETPARALIAQNTQNVFYDLPEMLLDVRAPKAGRALLKLRLTVELEDERDVSLVQRANPHILDAFITMLRNMATDDLEGPGLQRVQNELLSIVRKRAAPAKIRGVLFKEIMVS